MSSNTEVVRRFFRLAFDEKDPRRAVADCFGPYYRQHNPTNPDGVDTVTAYLCGLVDAYPQLQVVVKRTICEGDLVAVHQHSRMTPDSRGYAVVDIFRLENGRIVEHWDVLQEIPEQSANQNSMF